MTFGGSSSSNTLPHTHNQALASDGGQLSQTLTDMNGVTLYSLITDNSADIATNTADIATNTADIATNTADIAALNGVPSGVILMWSGSIVSIPAGWNLCDGTAGTVNLTNRFVRSGTSIGSTGGADTVTLTSAQSGLVAHNHGISDPGHFHSLTGSGGGSSVVIISRVTAPQANASISTTSKTTGITINNSSSSSAASSHDNMPSYYELAYIQKS
jgi:hypothetical protein